MPRAIWTRVIADLAIAPAGAKARTKGTFGVLWDVEWAWSGSFGRRVNFNSGSK
jgi:hypothetical protein